MPAHEILSFAPSEPLQQNSDLFLPVVEYLSGVDGVLEIRHGYAEEDKNLLYCIITWETVAHHNALSTRADFPNFFAKMKIIMDGSPGMFHVEFEHDSTLAFNAPTTEITVINLKEEKTRPDVKEVFDNYLGSKIRELPGAISHSAFWNETVEDPHKICAVIGWQSSKYHDDALQEQGLKGSVDQLTTLGDFTIIHVPFRTAFKKA